LKSPNLWWLLNLWLFTLCFLFLSFWRLFFDFIKFSLILLWHIPWGIIWIKSLINSRTITSWLLRIYFRSIVLNKFFFSLLSCFYLFSIGFNPRNSQSIFNRNWRVSTCMKGFRIFIELDIVIDLRTFKHFSRLFFLF